MKQTNRATRAAKRYLREARYNLLCSGKEKHELLTRLKDSLFDYVGERPHASYEDLVEHFGQPKMVADAYLADLSVEQLCKALQTARFVRRLLITVCTLIALLYGLTVAFMIRFG